jgi:hypothetical protein
MLRKGQIINYVIKPLIKEDRIKKNGNKRSFKNNTYVFRRKND